MISWLRRRWKRVQRTEDEAAALLARTPVTVRSEGRQRRQGRQDADVFTQWERVVRTVAQLTGRQIGLDTATRMADDADFNDSGETPTSGTEPGAKIDPIDELKESLVSKT